MGSHGLVLNLMTATNFDILRILIARHAGSEHI